MFHLPSTERPVVAFHRITLTRGLSRARIVTNIAVRVESVTIKKKERGVSREQ